MKILITGGAGYVGGVLTHHLLDNGYEVKVVDNMRKGNVDSLIPLCRNPKFSFEFGDITDKTACKNMVKGCDAIVNLAAIVGFPACQRNPTLSELTNVDGVSNLLAVRSRSQRFIQASTESVYGKAELCVETMPAQPTSLYAAQKHRAEQMVSNLPNTGILRFAAGMGVGYTTRINLLINTLVYEAIHNKVLVIYQADVLRNFISVRDMASAITFLLFNTQLANKVYNCGGVTTTKRIVAEILANKTGCTNFFGDVGEDKDNRSLALDVDRLTKAGFTCQYGLEETINELIKAMPMINVTHQYN